MSVRAMIDFGLFGFTVVVLFICYLIDTGVL